ncbi:MAG: hypothetical protein FJ029_09400 [Actinobacteria bacterium]|nr:hypothetical protein [Actinomycetota bacterium]
MLLRVLKTTGALATIGSGLVLVLKPRSVSGFTGLDPASPRGITEVRSAMGGLFTALGIAPLVYRSDAMYRALGLGYLAIAAVRAVSMLVDRSWNQRSNWLSLGFEAVFGWIMLRPVRVSE